MSTVVSTRKAPSVSAALVERNRIVFTDSIGWANIKTHQRATPDTLYHVGSITKMFTAVAIMQLVESGRLSLGTTLNRFYPNFPNAAKITIREMLMHRSGIPNYLDAAISDGRVMHPITPQGIVALVARMQPESRPGTAYAYSNSNYVLLGLIVERISGLPLRVYYARHIFEPAGMRTTYAGVAPPSIRLAAGYDLGETTAAQNPGDASWYYGCGDVLSTAGDLARFDIALMQGRLIRPHSLSEMSSLALPTSGVAGYGLGLMTFYFGHDLIEGHHGGLPGFESDDEMIVRDGFGIIALGNDFGFPTRSVLDAAYQSIYPRDYAMLVARREAIVAKEQKQDTPLTARFTAFLQDILQGHAPNEHLDAEMASTFTPAFVVQLQQSYAAYGAFRHLTFTGQDHVDQYNRYYYTAVFARGSRSLMFVTNSAGAIAGFFQ